MIAGFASPVTGCIPMLRTRMARLFSLAYDPTLGVVDSGRTDRYLTRCARGAASLPFSARLPGERVTFSCVPKRK
ncbi:Hypothetical protein I596_3500 [Dokdonella koreensis DS-123]|uniref:Uncharacterized protein n=1 Tax=Dokdonella koreensis DS-123 TaxID=1300342 RepID=A0A160DXN2_9GAMM|nr:Hypothetical protein I596_3500 [Dokdonella koreensis DS-123]